MNIGKIYFSVVTSFTNNDQVLKKINGHLKFKIVQSLVTRGADTKLLVELKSKQIAAETDRSQFYQ